MVFPPLADPELCWLAGKSPILQYLNVALGELSRSSLQLQTVVKRLPCVSSWHNCKEITLKMALMPRPVKLTTAGRP